MSIKVMEDNECSMSIHECMSHTLLLDNSSSVYVIVYNPKSNCHTILRLDDMETFDSNDPMFNNLRFRYMRKGRIEWDIGK